MPNVLIATTDANALAVLTAELESEGYTVIPATDGQDALALAAQASPILALLDTALPVFSGIEAATMMQSDPDVPDWMPVYFLTDDDLNPHTIDKAHAAGIFPKTHQHHELRELMSQVLQTVPPDYLI